MSPLRVLIVDDRETARQSLVLSLDDFNCEFHESESVASALRMIYERQFDAVILDLRLPDGSGLDVLREAARFQLNRAVIVVTGLPDELTKQEALRLGAFDYVVKLDYHELRAAFAKLLTQSSKQSHG